MKKIQISPSILSADFSQLGNEIKRLEEAGADMIHVDVMDGHFVPNLTIGPPVIKALKKYSSLPFDVHLMISPVHNYIQAYSDAGADVITIHPEATDNLASSISKIKEVDKKDIFQIAIELLNLSKLARSGKLGLDDMKGGVFTVSSLGGIGGTSFTPIINAPEVAILGISKNFHKPVYRDGVFIPRLILPISLSYDHRVIDGADGVRFTTFLSSVMNKSEFIKEVGGNYVK